ncbi:PAS domain S-box protein [Melioribacteraceae bacterium 4301-Me]|uniref:sensor histidine kinase n=1 Tax=Pyranulibacter aquaticus TaxID=3163344 RepID=UPI0035963501
MNSLNQKNKYFWGSFKNVLFLFLFVTILLSVAGVYYYNTQKTKIINDRFEYLKSISDFRLVQLNEWLKKNYSELEVLKNSNMLISTNRRNFLTSNNIDAYKKLFDVLKSNYNYNAISLLDNNFNEIISTSNSNITSEDSLLGKASLDSNKIIFSDANLQTSQQNEIKFYVPLKENYSSPKSAVLIISYFPREIFNPILNNYFDRSPTMETLLVKPYGDSVFYLNNLRFASGKNTDAKNSRRALIQTKEIKGRNSFFDGIDYKNDEVIARIKKVPATVWFLITKINKSEFYEPANRLAELVFLTVFSLSLLFAVILVFLWRKNIAANIKKAYQAEIEKYKVENRLQSVINEVKDIAIFIIDNHGKVTSWNEGAKKIKGYSEDEIIGKHFSVFYSKEDLMTNKPNRVLQDALLNGHARHEGWIVRKDGSTFWANTVITSLVDEKGETYGFLNITHDLTEKRKAEEEIIRSRDFYLKLLNDFPNPVWRSDTQGKFNYCNKAWLNFTGRQIEMEIGDGWLENVFIEDKEKLLRDYSDSFNKQKSFVTEFRLKTSSGEYKWVLAFGIPYYDLENKFLGYIGSCYDIDDRKKYEETINTLLIISEKLYSSLEVDQISDSLITESLKLIDAEGGFAAVKNDSEFVAKRYYYLDHWEYLDSKWSVDNPYLQKFVKEKDSYISNNLSHEHLLSRDLVFKYKVRNVLTTPLYDSAGELIGFFELHNKKKNKTFTIEDVNLLRGVARNASISISKSLVYEKLRKTEHRLRNSESELRKLAAQIQYARETERQHIAREIHDELGQLLTGINLNISLLTEMLEQHERPTTNEILTELYSVQDFVNKGIQTVKDISSSLRPYVLDHLGLIPAVAEYCREIERVSNVKCNFVSDFDTLSFNDEENLAIFRIIQEALTNVVRHAEATKINISVSEIGENLEIKISDNGKGMNFNDELQVDSMGILGMKERAIFLGGKLNIESTKEKGTKVQLILPLKQKERKL